MSNQITVYSTPTCPFCRMVKDYLKEKNIGFTDIDVSVDSKAAEEMVKKTGQVGVPVIEVDDQVIIGFDKERLNKLLNL